MEKFPFHLISSPMTQIKSCIPFEKKILPLDWKRIQSPDPLLAAYSNNKLIVLASIDTLETDIEVIHLSVSKKWQLMPTYANLCNVKKIFLGADKEAIQYFTKDEDHINLHPNCFHLWCFEW